MRHHLLRITYLLSFFVALHAFVTLYINSSALALLFSESVVSILFTVGSVAGIAGLLAMPSILTRFGNVTTSLFAVAIEIAALVTLALNPHPLVFVLAFLIHLTFIRILQILMDVFLETVSDKRREGRERGTFLTITNTALVLSPLIIGFLLDNTALYERVYIAATIALIPALPLIFFGFSTFRDSPYMHVALLPALKKIMRAASLRRIFIANFLLRVFYAVMVVYTPLYLHLEVGLPWDILGIIFTVMLLPFAVLEYPLGRLADTRYGEKEMLALGFLITGVATALVSFTTTTNFIVWTAVLLGTRIGASIVEIMTETYFFKKADVADTELVSVYRIVEPAAYIATGIVVSLFLFFFDVRFVFLALGVLLLLGIRVSTRLRDTL